MKFLLFKVTSDSVSTTIIFYCRHSFHEACLLTDEVLPNPPETSGISLVGSKVRHTIVLKSRNRPPQCPICNDAEHTHEKPIEKKAGVTKTPIRGFVRGHIQTGSRDDDGMPPMVPLRL
jgi:hypothetical protein